MRTKRYILGKKIVLYGPQSNFIGSILVRKILGNPNNEHINIIISLPLLSYLNTVNEAITIISRVRSVKGEVILNGKKTNLVLQVNS